MGKLIVINHSLNRLLLTLTPLICGLVSAKTFAVDWNTNGHLKYRWQNIELNDKQLGAASWSGPFRDHFGVGRLNINLSDNHWSGELHNQLGYFKGDSTDLSNSLFGESHSRGIGPSDNLRLFDLTKVVNSADDSLLVNRVDRLWVGFQDQNHVVKIGRQVISWGNGLIYNPMDFFNPFAPDALDTEYKTGDDMIYFQRAFHSGADLQIASVIRRNTDSKVDSDVNSYASKYHTFIGEYELDILLSQHYDDIILGLGGIASIGKGIIRGDIIATQTERDSYMSLVGNYTYSWQLSGLNMSGVAEYFYNDIGLDREHYSLIGFTQNIDLRRRIQRGELFTLGKHYAAASILVELSPLWQLTPNVFYDHSASSTALQITSQYSLADNGSLLLAFYLPQGKDTLEVMTSSEPDSGNAIPRTDWIFSSQIAWYF